MAKPRIERPCTGVLIVQRMIQDIFGLIEEESLRKVLKVIQLRKNIEIEIRGRLDAVLGNSRFKKYFLLNEYSKRIKPYKLNRKLFSFCWVLFILFFSTNSPSFLLFFVLYYPVGVILTIVLLIIVAILKIKNYKLVFLNIASMLVYIMVFINAVWFFY